MTKRGEKQNEGRKKEKKGHGGLHQLFEKNAQEVTFLTPLLWLDSCSTLSPPPCEKLPILLNTSLVQEITYKCAIHWKTAEAEDKEAGVA